MPVSGVTVLAPANGSKLAPAVARPRIDVKWTDSTNLKTVDYTWDDDPLFGNANGRRQTVQHLNIAGTSDNGVPTADLALLTPGTVWYLRAVVTDQVDAATGSSSVSFTYLDTRAQNRYQYLLASAGVGFTPTDDPAGGWGTSIGGTQGPDGNVRVFNRYQYLLANLGVGFKLTDLPLEGWDTAKGANPEGGDGDEIDFNRYLYALANVTSTQPCPFVFSISPTQAKTGDAVTIKGQGLVSATKPTADAYGAEVRLYASASFAAAYVVLAITDYIAGSTEDVITATIPGGATTGYVAIVHTVTPSCTGSNFTLLTVTALQADREAGWWLEVWNLRNSAPIIRPLTDVAGANFEHIPNDIGRGFFSIPSDHPDLSLICDPADNVETLAKVYLHNRFAYSFHASKLSDPYEDDGASLVRISGEGQERILGWGKILWKDYPAQPAQARTWLYGSTTPAIDWGTFDEATNLVTNGGSEDGDEPPWEARNGGVLFATSDHVRTGAFSLKATPAAVGDGAKQTLSVTPGWHVWITDFWVADLTSSGDDVTVRVIDSASTVLDTVTVPLSVVWANAPLDFIVPAGVSSVTLEAFYNDGTGTPHAFYIEDVEAYGDPGPIEVDRATVTLTTEQANSGQFALKCVANAGGNVTFNGFFWRFPTQPNRAYTETIAVHVPAGKVVRYQLRVGGVLTEVDHTGTGAWVILSLSGTAGNDDTVGRASIASRDAAALTFYVDDISPIPGAPAANAGKITRQVHEAMVARGTLAFVQLNFSDTADSGGNPWPENLAIELDPQWSLEDWLQKLVGLGYDRALDPVNWLEGGDTGWELSLWRPNGAGVDHSVLPAGPVILPGPTVETAEGDISPPTRTVVFAEGSGGVWSSALADAAAITALERREDYISNGQILNSSLAQTVAAQHLANADAEKDSYTIQLTDDGEPLPYFDLLPYDKLRAHLPKDGTRDEIPVDTYRVMGFVAQLSDKMSFGADLGRYRILRGRAQALMLRRLLQRQVSDSYRPGEGSLGSSLPSGSVATSSSPAGAPTVHPHDLGSSDITNKSVSGDVTGTLPGPLTVAKLRGLVVPVPVAADDEKVLAYEHTGTPAWKLVTAGGGGGGGPSPYLIQPGLKPPASGNASDKEFKNYANGSSPTGTPALLWGNQGTRSATIKGGRLIITTPTGSVTRGGLFLADPFSGGSWTMTIRIAHDGAGNYPHAGLAYVIGGLTTPTDTRYLLLDNDAKVNMRDYAGSWGGYESNLTGRSMRASIVPIYLRLSYDGSGVLEGFFTFDPIIDEWQSLGSYSSLSDPSHVGVATLADGAGEGTFRTVVDFIRFNWTPDFDPTL